MFNTHKGRKWVMVADWGVETSVSFCRDEAEAEEAYLEAIANGADAFFGKTSRLFKHSDKETK